jgi:MFS family permease
MVLVVGFSALFVGNAIQSQMPQYANDIHMAALGNDASAPEIEGFSYSMLQGATAAGAVIGGLLLEAGGFLPPSPVTAIVAAALWCLTLVGFAATPNYGIALALLVMGGVFRLTTQSMAQTIVQLRAPAHLRGRILGVFNTSQQGLQVGAGITVGFLGGVVGARLSLALSALMLLAVCLGLLAYVLQRRAVVAAEPVPQET